MEKLIIVSNRLPFRIEKKGRTFDLKQSSGGLVTALQSLSASDYSVTWTGIADFTEEMWHNVKDTIKPGGYRLEPIFADKKKYHNYYNGFSNAMIWPLFHYFPSYAEYNEASFTAYKEINLEFAEHIIRTATTGATVWIHDYHLMLLPKLIRQARPDLRLGFFLHIPFPSYEILKFIPAEWRKEILESLIQADVVGFQTEEYAAHFKNCLAYFLGIGPDEASHKALIKVYPISVDYDKLHEAYSSAAVIRGRKIIQQRTHDLKMIFSVDRLDYTKGVINRLQAYEHLLETSPEYRGKVTFVINVVPSRDQMERYAERKRMIEENIGRINGLYGNVHWQPVIYQYRHLTFNQLLSFYTAADIALVTPLRDGMNLVAKEFVASRQDKKGVLILSEFAGSAIELKEAILVNPNDIQTLKNGIVEALSLGEAEQQHNMALMQQTIRAQDIRRWTGSFLTDLETAAARQQQSSAQVMTFSEKIELCDAYRKAKKRLILLDYDGTLVNFHSRPQDAAPGAALKELLSELSGQPENDVVIISGRDAATLDGWLGDTGAAFVAEHGALYRRADEPWQSSIRPSAWKARVEAELGSLCSAYSGTWVESKSYSVALHYRDAEKRSMEALKEGAHRVLQPLRKAHGFHVLHGNHVIEIRNADTDKGNTAVKLMNSKRYDFVLALGDDTTDEDMFLVLAGKAECFTIRVGIAPTKARYNLISVSNVLSFLDQLAKFRSLALNPISYPVI